MMSEKWLGKEMNSSKQGDASDLKAIRERPKSEQRPHFFVSSPLVVR